MPLPCRRLRRNIRGEVRFDQGSRALYATDGSNYRQVPIGVVLPRDTDDIIATVALCREFGAPFLPRGGGTSLAGQCCNTAVVLDILEIHGAHSGDRSRPAASPAFSPEWSSTISATPPRSITSPSDLIPPRHNRCTLGGMIGNNSCGVHSVMAGKTDDNIEALEILTYDGMRLKVGATSDEELDEHHPCRRTPPRRSTPELKNLRDRYSDLVRSAIPTSRAASPAIT